MSEYKFPENFSPDQRMDLIDDYSLIYGIEVFEGEDNTITTMVDGERVAVTEEFLSRQTREEHRDTTIDERGDVVVMRGTSQLNFIPGGHFIRGENGDNDADEYDEDFEDERGGPLQRSAFDSDEEYFDYLLEV